MIAIYGNVVKVLSVVRFFILLEIEVCAYSLDRFLLKDMKNRDRPMSEAAGPFGSAVFFIGS